MMRSRSNLLKVLIGGHILYTAVALATPSPPMIQVMLMFVIAICGGAFVAYLPILLGFIYNDDIREEDVVPFSLLFFNGFATLSAMWALSARVWSPVIRPSSDFVTFYLLWAVLAGAFSLMAMKIDHGRLPKLEAYYLARRVSVGVFFVICTMFALKWFFEADLPLLSE
jgi:hypothetical protein